MRAPTSASFNTFECVPACRSNILCEFSPIFFVFLQVLSRPKSPAPPASDDPAHRMSLPPGTYNPPPKWFCTCEKCGPNGKQLSNSTWYRHNPGGKFAKLMQRVREEIQMFPNPLPPRPSTRRKRRLEATEDAERISKRVAGSSSVRRSPDHIICASTERYRRKYISREFGLRLIILMDVRRPQ